MIAVLSPQYLSALYTQPEWAAAFRHDPKGEQSLLIPVRVQPCEVTGLLGPIVYVDLVGQDEATARQRLLAAVRHERAKPAQAPAFPQTMQHTITRQLNFPGDLPPIWKMPHQRDPLFLGREQLLQELHTTLATDHHVLLFEPASEREAGTSGAIETAVEYAYRYRSDYQVIAWIEADTHEALRSDLLSLAAELHLPQTNLSDQDALTAVIQWLHTHQNWLLVLDQVQEKEVLAPLMPLPQQGNLLVVTSTRSLESLAPLLELSQVPMEERTVLMQFSPSASSLMLNSSQSQAGAHDSLNTGRSGTEISISKTSHEKVKPWGLGKRQIIAMLIGIVIISAVDYYIKNLIVPEYTLGNPLLNPLIMNLRLYNILISLTFVVPLFFATKFGPWVGFAVALLGALIGHTLSKTTFYSYFDSTWYSYTGIALLGFLSGLAFLRTQGRYNTGRNIATAIVTSFIGLLVYGLFIIIGFKIASDPPVQFSGFYRGFFYSYYLPINLANIFALILLPILLIIYDKIEIRNAPTT